MAAQILGGGAGGFSVPSMDPFEVLRADYDPTAPPAAPKPAPPPAQIRPIKSATDLKIVRYLVGAAVMEPSSLANQAALFKPTILLLAAGLTHLIVTYLGRGWPDDLRNLFVKTAGASDSDGSLMVKVTQWLSITPLIIVAPIVFLAIFEMRHRNVFEDEMSRAIGEEDMREIESYYSVEKKDGKSGFWVLEYDGRIIGVMGLDGRKPGQQLDSVVDMAKSDSTDVKTVEDAPSVVDTDGGSTSAISASPYPLRSRAKKGSTTATTAPSTTSSLVDATASRYPSLSLPAGILHLRRFATSLSFRPAEIEDDLLSFACDYAFSGSSGSPSNQQIVIACRPAVEKGLAKRLRKNGWVMLGKGDQAELSSEREKKQGGLVEMLWPLDLSPRTFSITREQWEKRVQ